MIPPEQPPREQTRFVIVAMAMMVVVGLVLAVLSIRDFFGEPDDVFAEPQFTPSTSATRSATPSASQAPSVTPSPGPSANAAAVPVIEAIRALDPEGDGDEGTDTTPRAVDGSATTTWRSEAYNSARFGGLKDGVGLSLRLRLPAAVSVASLDVQGVGGRVELRVGNSPDVEKAKVVASAAMNEGTVTLRANAPVRGRYAILWFTQLPSAGGKFRVEVSEVRVQ